MIILGTNSIKDTGYDIDYSCRFRYDGDDRMDRTIESPTLGTKWTFSTWLKRDNLGDYHHILTSTDNPGNWDSIRISNGDKFQVLLNNESTNLTTTAVYRDMSAWYSFIVAYDSTQGTASNRVKLYVNGTQVTAFDTSNYPSENYIPNFQVSGETLRIGANTWSIGTGHEKLGGYIAETFFIDGVAHAPTDFGEFDSDSPTIWKPKDCSGDFTYGTNGFYLDFADSGDLGDDESGNGNDFAETNLTAIDQCTDTPTNNFATLNPLQTNAFDPGSTTFSEGNTKYVNGGSASFNSMWLPTIGVTSGKWYGEFKLGSHSTSSGHSIGIYRTKSEPYLTGGDVPASDMVRIIFADTSNIVSSFGSTAQSSLGSCSSGDIFGLYFDADDGKLHCYKNGSAYITQLTGITIAGYTWYMHTQGEVQSSRSLTFEHNYGNPSFSISSSNADPNGYGSFEYSTTENSVGYYALCTKNLAEFG